MEKSIVTAGVTGNFCCESIICALMGDNLLQAFRMKSGPEKSVKSYISKTLLMTILLSEIGIAFVSR